MRSRILGLYCHPRASAQEGIRINNVAKILKLEVFCDFIGAFELVNQMISTQAITFWLHGFDWKALELQKATVRSKKGDIMYFGVSLLRCCALSAITAAHVGTCAQEACVST